MSIRGKITGGDTAKGYKDYKRRATPLHLKGEANRCLSFLITTSILKR